MGAAAKSSGPDPTTAGVTLIVPPPTSAQSLLLEQLHHAGWESLGPRLIPTDLLFLLNQLLSFHSFATQLHNHSKGLCSP